MEDFLQRAASAEHLDYAVALDTTLAVTERMKEIEHTLIEVLVLVIIVVFLFLQGWRATLIPLLAVPVSLVGTFALFPLFGFSINTLSLFGLVLAIGLVVDDAIVVVEAVEHHIEHGMPPKEATFKAMEEVSGPVVAIAIILAAVFVPTAFIPGITGRLYQQARAVDAYEEAAQVSLKRYVAGKASYYEILQNQQNLFPAETTLAQIQLNELLAIVQLYRALGGGWQETVAL